MLEVFQPQPAVDLSVVFNGATKAKATAASGLDVLAPRENRPQDSAEVDDAFKNC